MRKTTDSNNFKNLMGDNIFIQVAERMEVYSDFLDENKKESKEKYEEMKEELQNFLEVFLEEFETKLQNKKNETQDDVEIEN